MWPLNQDLLIRKFARSKNHFIIYKYKIKCTFTYLAQYACIILFQCTPRVAVGSKENGKLSA